LTDSEVVEFLSHQYGFTLQEIRQLTRREISEYFIACGARINNYPTNGKEKVIKLDQSVEDRINRARTQRLKEIQKELLDERRIHSRNKR